MLSYATHSFRHTRTLGGASSIGAALLLAWLLALALKANPYRQPHKQACESVDVVWEGMVRLSRGLGSTGDESNAMQ